MKEDPIKTAFLKAKKDINDLYNEILYLKAELNEIKLNLKKIVLTNQDKTDFYLNKTDNLRVILFSRNKAAIKVYESMGLTDEMRIMIKRLT